MDASLIVAGAHLLSRVDQTKSPPMVSFLFGDLTSINLEHLFDDLFILKDRFKALGMRYRGSGVYLADLHKARE